MLQVVSDGMWKPVIAKAKQARTRRAAIAYVGDDPPIAFGEGDLLVVDASDASIRCGRTSAATLTIFHEAGAQLFSLPSLHAKVMLLDDWAVVGSANDSRQSVTAYAEAAILSDRPDVAGQLERVIGDFARASKKIDAAFLKRILALPVKRVLVPPAHRRSKTRRAASAGQRAWIVSLRQDAEYPGDVDRVEAIAKEEQQKLGRGAGHVDWFFWSGKDGFAKRSREGDVVIECCRPRNKFETTRSVRVYRHGRVMRIFKEPGVKATTFHCLLAPGYERTALSWSRFRQLATSAGVRRKLSPRSTVELSAQQSAALFELWSSG